MTQSEKGETMKVEQVLQERDLPCYPSRQSQSSAGILVHLDTNLNLDDCWCSSPKPDDSRE